MEFKFEEVLKKPLETFKKNPLLAGGVITAVGVGIFWLLSPKNELQQAYAPFVPAPELIPEELYPENGGTADQTAELIRQLMAQMEDIYYAGQEAHAQKFASMEEGVKSLFAKMYVQERQQVQPVQQTFPQQVPKATPKVFAVPVADVWGGVGGGHVYTTSAAQMKEFLAGGEQNIEGSYRIDFTGWEPSPGLFAETRGQVAAITGKTGTIEQQLAGMTSEQKMATLKEAGLVR